MLLTASRTRLIHLCLLGMEVGWFVIFWSLLYPPAAASPWLAYFGLAATLLTWMLALDLLARSPLKSPAYDVLALGLMALTSLLAVRLFLYGRTPALDFRWIDQFVQGLLDFRRGVPPALALIGANLFLWQRATVATSRDLGFFSVGVSFRLGLLLSIAGLALWTFLRSQAPVDFLWLYVFLGLLAVALARINDKATDAQSAGNPLRASRLLQLVLSIGVTLGVARLLAAAYTPEGIRGFLRSFDPVWQFVRPAVMLMLRLLAQLLNPIFVFLEDLLRSLFRGNWPDQEADAPALDLDRLAAEHEASLVPAWLSQALLGILTAVVVIGAAAMLLGVLVLYLEKARSATEGEESEEESTEALTFGGGMLGRGLRALGDAARLVGRYGLSRRLLEAISVQNMYANLCRLAAERGHARPPAQPPDAYLPALAHAFPGHDDALARITTAYMRVHYGDRAATPDELLQAREDYLAIRQAGPNAQAPS